MKTILIIDGYNVIFGWPELSETASKSMDQAREKLIDRMANYAGFSDTSIIIVFDAQLVKGSLQKEECTSGIEVIYTGKGETADECIEKLVSDKDWQGSKIFVATSDRTEQTIIFARGAYRLSVRELVKEIYEAEKSMAKKLQGNSNNWRISSILDKDVLQKLEKIRREPIE